MDRAQMLRKHAAEYRRLARTAISAEQRRQLLDLAEQCETIAADIERRGEISQSANPKPSVGGSPNLSA